jgi:DNA-binding MarR family transcriptional regulator
MSSHEPNMDNLQLIEDIDRMIHAPARLKIMACLAIVESADFTFLMRQTGLTRGNLSPNLRKLEEADYVSIQKKFVDRVPRTLIRLTDKGRAALQTYRESMQSVLNELLGR